MYFHWTTRRCCTEERSAEVPADNVVTATHLDLAPLEKDAVVLVKLELKDPTGKLRSSNLYWVTSESRNLRTLSRLPPAKVNATATATRDGDKVRVRVELENVGADVALESKLTLVNSATGERILPAYYSDNYVSLLPGEKSAIDVEYPVSVAGGATPAFTLRGFNLPQQSVPIAGGR